jgi:hypothetical protein
MLIANEEETRFPFANSLYFYLFADENASENRLILISFLEQHENSLQSDTILYYSNLYL